MRERPILFSAPMVLALLAGTKTQTRRIVGLDTLRRSETPGYDWTWRGQAPVRSIAQQRRHPRGCWQDVRHGHLLALCPQGRIGDRLWVRETHRVEGWDEDGDATIRYRADDAWRSHRIDPVDGDQEFWIDRECARFKRDGGVCVDDRFHMPPGKSRPWRPAIFLERWMSRVTREIVSVRVERLQDISEADAQAEGVELPDCTYVFGGDETGEQSNGLPCFKNSCPRHGRLDRYRLAFRSLWDSINGKRDCASWDANPWVWAITFKVAP